MSHPVPDGQATAAPGLIDTFQAGFNTINRALWLLALPIAIDLLLWLGPQAILTADATPWLRSAIVQGVERVGPTEILGQMDQLPPHNLLWLLVVPLFGVPSFRAGAPGVGPSIPLDTLPTATATLVGAVFVGLAAAAAFYSVLAEGVRSGRFDHPTPAAHIGRQWLRLVGLFLLAVATLGLFGTMAGLILLGASALAPAFLSLVPSLLIGLLMCSFVYLFFTADALFISLVGPLEAVKHSISVVRYNVWSSLAFISLFVLISYGMPLALGQLERRLAGAGAALAILGHVYVSSGLSAASMTYYKERFARLPSKVPG